MKRLVLFLFLVVASVSAKYQQYNFVLENGLRVICIKKSTAPIVAFSVWYKCGSKCDAISKSGVAHYLEHMAFESDNGEFKDFLDAVGADKNAFTSLNVICFHEIVPKNHLEKVVAYEAARMQSLNINDKIFTSEGGAILEERGMRVDENPAGCYSEATLATVFNRKSGGIPIIGWKHEIESITKQDLYDFHAKWFAPNNAIIVIVGDIEENEVKGLVEKHFSKIQQKELPDVDTTDIEFDDDIKKEIEYRSPKIGNTAIANYIYRVPFSATDDFRKSLALEIAVSALNLPTSFASNLLKQILSKVEEISFGYISRTFAFDIVEISVTALSLDNLNDAKAMLRYAIDKVAKKGISQEDLDAVKKRKMISIAYKEDDIEDISNYFGWLSISGYSIDEILARDEIIQTITLEECNEVLHEVFSRSPISVSNMLPKGYDRD